MLKGRTALVTGSTSGIGLGIAKCLAKQGCDLVMSGSRTEEDAREILEGIRKEFQVEVVYCQADFSYPQKAAEKLINEAIDKFGSLHILGKSPI